MRHKYSEIKYLSPGQSRKSDDWVVVKPGVRFGINCPEKTTALQESKKT